MSTIIIAPKPRRFLPMEEILNLTVEISTGKGNKQYSPTSKGTEISNNNDSSTTTTTTSMMMKSSNNNTTEKKSALSLQLSMDQQRSNDDDDYHIVPTSSYTNDINSSNLNQ